MPGWQHEQLGTGGAVALEEGWMGFKQGGYGSGAGDVWGRQDVFHGASRVYRWDEADGPELCGAHAFRPSGSLQ